MRCMLLLPLLLLLLPPLLPVVLLLPTPHAATSPPAAVLVSFSSACACVRHRSHLVAGGVAGCSAVLLLHPFDVVKTRLQGEQAAAAAQPAGAVPSCGGGSAAAAPAITREMHDAQLRENASQWQTLVLWANCRHILQCSSSSIIHSCSSSTVCAYPTAAAVALFCTA
jgi:hypothetical protein